MRSSLVANQKPKTVRKRLHDMHLWVLSPTAVLRRSMRVCRSFRLLEMLVKSVGVRGVFGKQLSESFMLAALSGRFYFLRHLPPCNVPAPSVVVFF